MDSRGSTCSDETLADLPIKQKYRIYKACCNMICRSSPSRYNSVNVGVKGFSPNLHVGLFLWISFVARPRHCFSVISITRCSSSLFESERLKSALPDALYLGDGSLLSENKRSPLAELFCHTFLLFLSLCPRELWKSHVSEVYSVVDFISLLQ